MKNEIMENYNMFSDCWKLYRELYPPQPQDNEPYWENVVQRAHEMAVRYPSQLCKDILAGITNDLNEKSKCIA